MYNVTLKTLYSTKCVDLGLSGHTSQTCLIINPCSLYLTFDILVISLTMTKDDDDDDDIKRKNRNLFMRTDLLIPIY